MGETEKEVNGGLLVPRHLEIFFLPELRAPFYGGFPWWTWSVTIRTPSAIVSRYGDNQLNGEQT